MEGLAPGYWVRLTLREPVDGENQPVGKVQHVDDHGIRLTLLDGLTGTAQGWDFYAPWTNVLGAVVATPDHDVRDFVRGVLEGKQQQAKLISVPPDGAN